jgi:hypothetical protein
MHDPLGGARVIPSPPAQGWPRRAGAVAGAGTRLRVHHLDARPGRAGARLQADRRWHRRRGRPAGGRIPGAGGQPHTIIHDAGRFLQEDQPAQLARPGLQPSWPAIGRSRAARRAASPRPHHLAKRTICVASSRGRCRGWHARSPATPARPADGPAGSGGRPLPAPPASPPPRAPDRPWPPAPAVPGRSAAHTPGQRRAPAPRPPASPATAPRSTGARQAPRPPSDGRAGGAAAWPAPRGTPAGRWPGRAGDRQATVHGADPSAAGTRGRHLDRQQRAKRMPDQHRMQVGGEGVGGVVGGRLGAAVPALVVGDHSQLRDQPRRDPIPGPLDGAKAAHQDHWRGPRPSESRTARRTPPDSTARLYQRMPVTCLPPVSSLASLGPSELHGVAAPGESASSCQEPHREGQEERPLDRPASSSCSNGDAGLKTKNCSGINNAMIHALASVYRR